MRDRAQELTCNIKALRRYAVALTGNPADADDLVQETLRRALDYGGNGRRIRNWTGYLFKILHNVRNDQVSKLSANAAVPMDEEDIRDIGCSPTQDVRIECLEVRNALERLPEEYREILLLVGLQGFSYREAAEVLEIHIGTVMSRLCRGREAVRRLVMDSGDSRLRRVK